MSVILLHGSACPHHCVCNGTHLSRRCWCAAPWKPPVRRSWLRGLRVRLLGGGRPLGYFDCPPALRRRIWGETGRW
jgi:hypothetical protein